MKKILPLIITTSLATPLFCVACSKPTPPAPYIPVAGQVSFNETTVTTDSETKIAIYHCTWSGDLPVDKKFDNIEIFYTNNSNSHSLQILNEPTIGESNKFDLQIRYNNPEDYGLSEDTFKLNFVYKQQNISDNFVSEILTIKHEGPIHPEGEGFLYLYNGTSVLYGQSGRAGTDSKNWACYYFPNGKAMGKDVTSEAQFTFVCETTNKIQMSNNTLTWSDGIEKGMHWGYIKAQWEDDGDVYFANSQEIVVNISDFTVTNPNPSAYNDTLVQYGFLKSGWICSIDGEEKSLQGADRVEITGDSYSVYNLFEWDNNNNRIKPKSDSQADGTYENIRIKVTYTINNCTFVNETDNIKITIKRS